MAYKTFAAIDVGSNQINMKIYEIASKKAAREIDSVSGVIELGSDTYRNGRIEESSLDKLCDILNKFKKKMKEYRVAEYRAYATSAVREAENAEFVIERIMMRTGMKVEILSNSEQRFMNYKAYAAKKGSEEQLASKNAALLDIGAGSLQISIFDKQNLVNTQNLPIGAVRIRDYLQKFGADTVELENIMEEYVSNFILEFRNMFLNEKEIKRIIAIGDGINNLKKVGPELNIENSISREQFGTLYKRVFDMNPEALSENYGIPYEQATLMLPMAIIYQSFLDKSKAEEILTPNVTFCDGIVAHYMDKEGYTYITKDFDNDIIQSAYSLAKRYKCNTAHIENVCSNALAIFDSFKGTHGMDKRERLQLQIAAILHCCGKYINMNESTLISYYIIMATEILGLSHKEREEIANIVRYNVYYLPSAAKASGTIKTADYMKVAKLAAILRLADVLDKSHKQKIDSVRVTIKNDTLTIVADTFEDITLEIGTFKEKTALFKKVYGIKPVLKQRRGL